jgi:hypothetical protein
MSRRSIDSRMDRIMARLLPPGSMAAREHGLPEHLRAMLDHHRSKTAAIIDRCQKIGGPGEFYRRMIEGEIDPPPMPQVLRDALRVVDPPALTEGMDAATVAHLYNQYAQGDEQ